METNTKTQSIIIWNVDPSHSHITFKVRHMMISYVNGEIKEYDLKVETTGEDFSSAKISFSANPDSITTGSEQRDGHLLSDDFFNTEKFPAMTFKGNSLMHVGDDHWTLQGDITIRDVTQPISLQANYMGKMDDPWGNTRVGFEVNGKINRKEFGLKWDVVTEAGGIVVSDEVRIHCNLEFIREKTANS
ncbi:MAG: YceI family protein [Chitinophagales bacterium]|nr:YceI family protein [Chitinophagales bacterium]